MRPAQQHRYLGVSVQASEDMLIVQVGTETTALRTEEFRKWLKCATRELFRAETFDLYARRR